MTVTMVWLIPDVFRLMLPESYYPAIWVIPSVAGAVFFMFLFPLFGSVEFYYEAKKYVTIASILGALLNVGLKFIFIKIFGFIAAAYTTLFCYICFSIFHYFAMKIVLKKQGVTERIYDMKRIILISILLLISIIMLTLMYQNNIMRWCTLGAMFVLAVIFKEKIFNFVKELRG